MKKIKYIFILLITLTLISCNKEETPEPDPKETEIELLSDNNFQNGFTINPADNEPQPDNRYPLDYDIKFGSNPISWIVGLAGNRFGLADQYAIDGNEVAFIDGTYYIEDTSKKMIVTPETGKLTLELNASKEYLRPRQSKEAWPHLLLQQGLTRQVTVEDVNQINLNLDITLNKLINHMTEEEYDSSLHTTQFLMYIVVRTNNAKDAGDYIWFGIPFLDSRYKLLPEGGMIDAGTAGNTGQFIYQMPQADFMPDGLVLNETIKINVDIVPYLSRALLLAKEKGALLNSSLDDLYLTSMNIGYEVTGTYDVSITLENFSLLAHLK